MSIETLKLEKGLCRCCLNEGVHKNLAEPWLKAGGVEIYADMLQSCLDINLTPLPGPHCNVTYTICEACIERLRDACSFKQQVNECERRFREYYSKSDIKLGSCIDIEVKRENIDDEDIKLDLSPIHDDDDFRLDDFDGDDETKVSDVDIKSGPRKLRPKKAKASEKAKAKSKPARKPKDEAANPESRKKGDTVSDYMTETSGDQTKKFACNACNVSYKRISDLRYHVIRSHLKQKFIKCKYCHETFMYHSKRKEHVASQHTKVKPNEFVCGCCNRQFKRKNTLAEHMMDVHIEKKCTQCDLKFVRKRYLFHLNEAHGVSMPTCGVCGLRTLMESALIRHQRKVHLNEKNKTCAICKKGFYTESNLQDHMITHNQLRVFKCDVCTKTFARRECYKAHYRIHTGERPYSCVLCSAAFVQRASLRFHMKSHHRGTKEFKTRK